ncbi:MAG: SRPBCC family protein [Acidimicrobiales bacterium]
MSEQAKEQIRIAAPVDRCFATLVDFASYPEWAGDLKEVAAVETDAEGRAIVVEFRAAAMGRSTTYQLRYDYSEAPHRLGWELVEGDLPRELDGAYVLTEVDGGASTEVVYELAIDLVYPIPGFVKRRAEGRIIKTALGELKARVEGSPRPIDED